MALGDGNRPLISRRAGRTSSVLLWVVTADAFGTQAALARRVRRLEHWLLVLGVGFAVGGCFQSRAPIHSAHLDPTCADACILGGREDLSECLRECGGADFTAELGCFDTCYPRPEPAQEEDSGGGSFLAELIGAVIDAAVSGDDDDSDSSSDDGDYAEPAGPAPEERPDPPSESKPSKPKPAKPSKSRTPARPSRG